jgi:hypothetical protein
MNGHSKESIFAQPTKTEITINTTSEKYNCLEVLCCVPCCCPYFNCWDDCGDLCDDDD